MQSSSPDIEQQFSGLVRSFISSFPLCRQAYARRVVYSWCAASGPTPLELRRAYWREYYALHRDELLASRRKHYRQRQRQNFGLQ